MVIRRLIDWLTLADYEREKKEASGRIVKRFSRGNVSAQNGWYMTGDDYQAIRRMRKRLPPCAA